MSGNVVITERGHAGDERRFHFGRIGRDQRQAVVPPHVTECVVFTASASLTPPFDRRPRSPSLSPLSVIGLSSRTSHFRDCHI